MKLLLFLFSWNKKFEFLISINFISFQLFNKNSSTKCPNIFFFFAQKKLFCIYDHNDNLQTIDQIKMSQVKFPTKNKIINHSSNWMVNMVHGWYGSTTKIFRFQMFFFKKEKKQKSRQKSHFVNSSLNFLFCSNQNKKKIFLIIIKKTKTNVCPDILKYNEWMNGTNIYEH